MIAGYRPDEVIYDVKLSRVTSEGESCTMFYTNEITNVRMLHRVTSDRGGGKPSMEPSCEM